MGCKAAVRMDDITPEMDWEKFHAFQKILEEYGIAPLLGVVPDNRDANLIKDKPRADFWEYIKTLQDRGWMIAMHGCYHTYTSQNAGIFPLNCFSEFAGTPYEKQKKLLAAGVELLRQQGIVTNIFMPPAHSFDKNTLRALRELGFCYITDGFGSMPYEREQMIFLPICERRNKKLSGKGVTTFVVHTNTMEEADFAFYRKLFAENETMDYAAYMAMPHKRRGFFGNAKEYAAALAKRWIVKIRAAFSH